LTYRNLGRVLTAKHEFAEAVRAYRDSLAITSRLIERYGSTEQWQEDRRRAISSLGGLSYKLVKASEFAMALQVAEQAIDLAPDLTWLHSNRAHAPMFLQRVDDARAVYLAFRGRQKAEGERSWEAVILDDFAELRKAGLTHPLMDEIEKKCTENG
jgi:tetratricopeptide (TPR) repeat protein